MERKELGFSENIFASQSERVTDWINQALAAPDIRHPITES
jgi:hypothetical protein